MTGSALNWGRWLGRLGLKTDDAPPIMRSVAPVLLAADHRHLVSPLWRSAYVFGGELAPVAVQSWGVRVLTPVPVEVSLRLSCTTGAPTVEWFVGPDPSILPAPTTAVTPQFGMIAAPKLATVELVYWTDAAFPIVPTRPKFAALSTDKFRVTVRVPAGGFFYARVPSGSNTAIIEGQVQEFPAPAGE